MAFSNVAPIQPPTATIGAVRASCAVAREAAGIRVSSEHVDRFLLDVLPAAPSAAEIDAWLTTGFRLPLVYETVHDEVNVLSVLCFLNSLSGYRAAFNRTLGHGAHKVIVKIVMGLYIGDSSGAGRALGAETLASMTPMGLLTLLNLPTHEEAPHVELPAVVVGKRRRDEVYEALETLCHAANDAGQRLKAMGCPDLGVLVERLLQEAASEGKNDEERASIFVSKMTTAVPAYNDARRLPDGTDVYVHKRAFLTLSWLYAAFAKRAGSSQLPHIPDSAVLPAFVDNVLPSLLVHFGVLDLSGAKDTALRQWDADVKTKAAQSAQVQNQVDRGQSSGKEIVDGPTLDIDQAYVVRSAALDAIRRIALRAPELAKTYERPWLEGVNEALIDPWLWTQSKRPDLTTVPRMVEKNTFQY